MTLYTILKEIENLLGEVDPETGEVLFDEAAYEALEMERQTKIENVACLVKNLKADIAGMRQEEANLENRRTALEKKVATLNDLLVRTLDGEKFTTARVAITWRKSTRVEVFDDIFLTCAHNADLITYTPKFSKTAIAAAIKSGRNVPGAVMCENMNMTIK